MEKVLDDICRDMRRWHAFVRRHNANVFDVNFKDVDFWLTDDDLRRIISQTAGFYELELPVVRTRCGTLARMVVGAESPADARGSELCYNWQLMQKAGINNSDAFTLCMVHELSHLYLRGRRFFLFRNERWCHELAADYLVGIYSADYDIATGKYKYVVGCLPATLTHPCGEHRAAAVEYGRELALRHNFRSIDAALAGLPAFVYERSAALGSELRRCMADSIMPKLPSIAAERRIEDLPETNLIRQAVERFRDRKEG